MTEQSGSSKVEKKVADNSVLKQPGFKQLDLTIAYRALIQAFVRSEAIALEDDKTEKSGKEMYDNS